MGRDLPPTANRGVHLVPVDLVIVGAYALIALLLTVTPVRNGIAASSLAFGFSLVILGYPVVSIFYPGTCATRGQRSIAPSDGDNPSGGCITHVERPVLSVGASLVLSPLLWSVSTLTISSPSLDPFLLSSAVLTLGTVAVASLKRTTLPAVDRWGDVASLASRLRSSGSRLRPSRWGGSLVWLLSLVIVVSSLSVAFGLAHPASGEEYTELSLLTRTDDGETVAGDYPRIFENGTSGTVVVSVANQEGHRMDYRVLVRLQDKRGTGDGSTVRETEVVRRGSLSVADGESVTREYDLFPSLRGDSLRLEVLLYRGTPPANPSASNAYRSTYILTNVTAPRGQ